MDTGSTIVTLPTTIFDAVAQAIKGTTDQNGNLYVDCSSTLPDIALRIGGKDYAFAAEDLAMDVFPVNSTQLAQLTGVKQGNIACILPFVGGDGLSDGQSAPMAIVSDVSRPAS
jgi:hypothetical protein